MNIWKTITEINNLYGRGEISSITFLTEFSGYAVKKLQYGHETKDFYITDNNTLIFAGRSRKLK